MARKQAKGDGARRKKSPSPSRAAPLPLYGIEHATAYHFRTIVQAFRQLAGVIDELADEVGKLRGHEAAAREAIDLLRRHETIKTAVLFNIMAQTAPKDWPGANEGVAIGMCEGQVVTFGTPEGADGMGQPANLREVVQPLNENVDYWLSLYDNGQFSDVSVMLHGLASAVRTARPLQMRDLPLQARRVMDHVGELAEDQLQAGSVPGVDEPSQALVLAPRKQKKSKRGRRRVSAREETRRREILARWEQAKGAGVSRKEFCRDWNKMHGGEQLTLRRLENTQDWARQRKLREHNAG